MAVDSADIWGRKYLSQSCSMLLSAACQHESIHQAMLEMLNHSLACYLGNKPCMAEERCCERKKMRSPSRGSDTLKVIGHPKKILCPIASASSTAHTQTYMVKLHQLTHSCPPCRTNINHYVPLCLLKPHLTYRTFPRGAAALLLRWPQFHMLIKYSYFECNVTISASENVEQVNWCVWRSRLTEKYPATAVKQRWS